MKRLRYKYSPVYRRIYLLYGEKNGHAVLKGKRAWRKVNGVGFNTRKFGNRIILFRRY